MVAWTVRQSVAQSVVSSVAVKVETMAALLAAWMAATKAVRTERQLAAPSDWSVAKMAGTMVASTADLMAALMVGATAGYWVVCSVE